MKKTNRSKETNKDIKQYIEIKVNNTHSKNHYSNFINEEENHVTEKKVL